MKEDCMARRGTDYGEVHHSPTCPKKIFPIFSGFDLTFNYIWCIFYKTREGLKPGKVKRSITHREQSPAEKGKNPPNLGFLWEMQQVDTSHFYTEMRGQRWLGERLEPHRTSLEGEEVITDNDLYSTIRII
jgi:hypothetical protein